MPIKSRRYASTSTDQHKDRRSMSMENRYEIMVMGLTGKGRRFLWFTRTEGCPTPFQAVRNQAKLILI